MLTYQKKELDQATVLFLEGSLNLQTSRVLQREAATLETQSQPIVIIEASALTQIDSAGVGAVVALFKTIKGQGKTFKIVGLQKQPLEIFKLLNLHKVLELHDDMAQAIPPKPGTANPTSAP